MNNIDVLLIPKEIVCKDKELDDKLIVVIDVLRASSTIVTALAQGCNGFIPIFSPDKARDKAKEFTKGEVLLGGERKGRKIEGFILGNSPREYKKEIIKDKIIIFTTTNGVKTLEMAKNASDIAICSFLNLKAICDYCLNFNGDVLVICAGEEGKFSLEDAVCAGMLIDSLRKKSPEFYRETDANLTAQMLYTQYADNILGMLKESQHGQYLESIGLGRDLEFCSSVDIFDIVPIFKDGMIIGR
ncbi:MAG: 2-phosphosulfolactate phosphatase [Candidatus Caldatribacteriota bacterium]|nr:2-phosphosulfolactate phosphatase [Candidatus Caldatribacteriota bacterium]